VCVSKKILNGDPIALVSVPRLENVKNLLKTLLKSCYKFVEYEKVLLKTRCFFNPGSPD